MIDNYEEVYKKLLKHRGFEEQLGYFYEEIGELLQAINKYKRANGRITKFNIYEEIVDVQITLDILKVGYKMKNAEYADMMFIKIQKIKKYIYELDEIEKEGGFNK